MPTNYGTSRRFQFSLRTFLIVTCATGVAAGLLGRLFFRAPDVFLGISTLLCAAVPFLLAIGTIFWIGFRRNAAWSTPICGKCRCDLWPIDPNRMTNCPACGADLTESKALLFSGGQSRRWGLVAWGALLLAMPIVWMALVFVVQRAMGPSPGGLGLLSTQQLIQERLPKQVDEPWVWNELELRLKAGSLSQQDVDDAIKKLTLHMTTTRPQGWDSPLSWQNDFIKSAGQASLISEPVLIALCDAFYGPKPVIRPLPRQREGKGGFSIEIEYGNTWGSHSNLGLQLVWQVNRVLLDGKPSDVRQTHKAAGDWSGYHDGSLDAGDHQLTLEIECAYINGGKLIGLNADDLSKSLWPEARKRWTQTVSAPLKVFLPDEPIVSLVTNPGQHPGAGGGIAVSRFAVQRDRDDGKLIVLKTGFVDGLTIPLSYDIAVAFGEQTVDMGQMWVVQRQNGRTSSGGQMQKRLDMLDSTIRSADIILTPNPSHIEHRPEVSEIWGEKIILQNVPIERLDLE
jgi:hypothetical protein